MLCESLKGNSENFKLSDRPSPIKWMNGLCLYAVLFCSRNFMDAHTLEAKTGEKERKLFIFDLSKSTVLAFR